MTMARCRWHRLDDDGVERYKQCNIIDAVNGGRRSCRNGTSIMPPGSSGASGGYEAGSRQAGSYQAGSFRADWLSQFGGADRGRSSVSAQADHLAPLKIAIVALIALVLLGPLMTIEEGAAAGEGSVVRQIGYLMILALTIYAVRPIARGGGKDGRDVPR